MPERTFGTMSNYTLLAVPFFIFMGTVLEKSKLAEQLLETIGVAVRPLPRRARDRGDLRGRAARRGDGRGGRERDGDGAHLAAR